MKNTQKGFIVPLVIAVVAILVVGGAYLAYKAGKMAGTNQVNQTNNPLDSTTTDLASNFSSQPTSTTTQPAPVITSINPTTAKIGDTVAVSGENLRGFEGDKNLWIQNVSSGVKGIIHGDAGASDQSIKFVLADKYCTADTSYSGAACPSYLTMTPGNYVIFANPWDVVSNEVKFTVTVSTSSLSSKPSITVLSPNGGETFNMNSPIQVSWSQNYKSSFENIMLFSNKSDAVLFSSPILSGISGNNNLYMIPANSIVANPSILGNQYKISVCSHSQSPTDPSGPDGGYSICGTSDAFTITSSTTSSSEPSIKVISPNGGEAWKAGTNQTITVSITGDSGKLTNDGVGLLLLDSSGNLSNGYSLGGGSISNSPGTKSFQVTLPTNYIGNDKIYATLYNSTPSGNCSPGSVGCASEPQIQASDYSDNYFTITN